MKTITRNILYEESRYIQLQAPIIHSTMLRMLFMTRIKRAWRTFSFSDFFFFIFIVDKTMGNDKQSVNHASGKYIFSSKTICLRTLLLFFISSILQRYSRRFMCFIINLKQRQPPKDVSQNRSFLDQKYKKYQNNTDKGLGQ